MAALGQSVISDTQCSKSQIMTLAGSLQSKINISALQHSGPCVVTDLSTGQRTVLHAGREFSAAIMWKILRNFVQDT